MWFWIVTLLVLPILGYFLAIRPYKYWSSKGVKQGEVIPITGNAAGFFFWQRSFADIVKDQYGMFPNSRYSGIYQFFTPQLLIRDPDLLRQITVKDFDHFTDHVTFVSEENEPLWGKNLFTLKGRKWREMRSILSPAFTSSKMKQMFVLMVEVSKQFVQHFQNKEEKLLTVELKDTFTRFTNDVIASTAFGIKVNSLDEPQNEFYVKGKAAVDFNSFPKLMKMLFFSLMPKLYTEHPLFCCPMPQEISDFFCGIIKTTIANREKNGIVRPDMINILMEARKHGFDSEAEAQKLQQTKQDTGFATAADQESDKERKTNNKIELTDVDIAAQAFVFFLAGFDTVSDLMCFMTHELGVNPDIQERLRNEVDEVYQECDGKLTYDAVLGMKYMDMVVSETLRKWPVAIVMDRICTKPYTIPPVLPDEPVLQLPKGEILWIPIIGIHRDPQYYPDPDRFDPERFSDENKHTIKPYTYFPFGLGPRNCIGSRFALLETKVLFCCILSEFEIVPVEKTQVPIVLSKKGFSMIPEGGFWVGLKRREK